MLYLFVYSNKDGASIIATIRASNEKRGYQLFKQRSAVKRIGEIDKDRLDVRELSK